MIWECDLLDRIMLVKTCLAGKDLCRYKWIIRFRRRRNQQCAEGFPRDYQPLRSSYQYATWRGAIRRAFEESLRMEIEKKKLCADISQNTELNERRSGTTRNRTGDTRIFSPLLYQLSYGTYIFTI